MQAMILIVCLLTVGQPEKQVKKPTLKTLSSAVLRSNKMTAILTIANEDTKTIVSKTDIFKGEFVSLFKIVHITPNPDGSMTIAAILEARNPDQNRYMTQQQRTQIADMNAKIVETRKMWEQKIADAQSSYDEKRADDDAASKNSNGNNSGNSDDGGISGINGASGASGKQGAKAAQEAGNQQRLIRNMQQEMNKEIAKLKKQLLAFTKAARQDADARRAASEDIKTTIDVSPELAKTIDIESFTKKGRARFKVTVEDFGITTEPKDIGGSVIINQLQIIAIKLVATTKTEEKESA